MNTESFLKNNPSTRSELTLYITLQRWDAPYSYSLVLKLVPKFTASYLFAAHQKFWHKYQLSRMLDVPLLEPRHSIMPDHATDSLFDSSRIGFFPWIRCSSGLLNQNLLTLTYSSVSRMNSPVICQKPAIPFQIKITCWQSAKDIIPISDQGLN